jgi:hypothetical protein
MLMSRVQVGTRKSRRWVESGIASRPRLAGAAVAKETPLIGPACWKLLRAGSYPDGAKARAPGQFLLTIYFELGKGVVCEVAGIFAR